jgi:ankyrin repeat protein
MEWVGISGCLVLSLAFIYKAWEYRKENQQSKARFSLATAVYLWVFSLIIADYYSTKSILTAIVNMVPVEICIGMLIVFHIVLLGYSMKHPPFEKRLAWSEARRQLYSQMLFGAEVMLICFYLYTGVLYRDVSLVTASENGDFAEAQRCLALGADPMSSKAGGVIDEPTNVCLESALDHNNLKIASLLVSYGAPVDVADVMTHQTPLMYEVSKRNKEAVQFLLDHGANVNQTTGDGLIALRFACSDTDMARYLIEQGIFINSATRTGATVIFDFARAGNASGVRLLLKHGAKANTITELGYTPLMAAAKSGSAETVSVLISAGVDLRVKDVSGNDALYYAESGRRTNVARMIEHALKTHISQHSLQSREQNDTLSL